MSSLMKMINTSLLLVLGLLSMGNQSCQQKPPVDEGRILRRRVQMAPIQAPEIELPQQLGRKKFDFAFVANMQMYDILSKTQSFTTATIDPSQTWDPADLGDDGKARFNQCGDDGDVGVENLNYWTNSKAQAISRDAACMIYMPQAKLEGSIIDFTLVSDVGVSLGLAGIPFLSSVDFNMQRYMVSAELRAKHPLEIGDHYFSTVIMDKWGTDWGGALGLNFGELQVGPKGYFRTPLRRMVNEVFTEAVTQLRNNWNTDEPWYAMVMKNCDNYIYINGGYGNDVGLKVGDIVRIQNVKYMWDDQACKSQLFGEIRSETVAYAKVTAVGRNISEAWIIKDDQQYPASKYVIYPGSRVYMEKMVEPPKPAAQTQQVAQSTPTKKAAPVKQSYGRQ